jgi:hypothetical protein
VAAVPDRGLAGLGLPLTTAAGTGLVSGNIGPHSGQLALDPSLDGRVVAPAGAPVAVALF